MMINFLYNLFYILPLFFIWSEFYHIKYKNRLYVKFTERKSRPVLTDYIFYATKIINLLVVANLH